MIKKAAKTTKRTLKNISGREINVLSIPRAVGSIFTVELPKMNRWLDHVPSLSKIDEINNLITHKYLEEVEKDE